MKILRAGTLIDGTGAPPVRDAAVVINNGRIEAVTTAGPSTGGPPDAEVIDASRFTVLPGLIDCHDHLAFHGYELVRRWGLDEPPSSRHLRTARVAGQVLAAGYTGRPEMPGAGRLVEAPAPHELVAVEREGGVAGDEAGQGGEELGGGGLRE